MIVNAIFYVCGEGVKWRALPKDFSVPWKRVYWYFSKWSKGGNWAALNEQLVMIRRQAGGAAPLPSALIIDSQSVKNTACATTSIGIDGGKRIKGRKTMMVVDTQGNLLMVKVFAANRHDGPAALRWWSQQLAAHLLLSDVRIIRGDHHFGGVFKEGVEADSGVRVEVVSKLVEKPSQQAMPVHKGRWVVERTIAWESNSSRLSKDYERLPEHSEAFLLISSISRLIKLPS